MMKEIYKNKSSICRCVMMNSLIQYVVTKGRTLSRGSTRDVLPSLARSGLLAALAFWLVLFNFTVVVADDTTNAGKAGKALLQYDADELLRTMPANDIQQAKTLAQSWIENHR